MRDQRAIAPVIYRAVLLAGGLVVLGLLFRELLTLLLAVLMTTIFAIVIAAATDWLERFNIPRHAGAAVAVLTVLAAIAGILALVIPPFVDQTNEFVDDVPAIVDELRDQIHDLTGAKPGEISDRVQEFAQRYTDDPERLIGPLTSIGFSIAGILASLILMLITAYYMAVNPGPLLDGIVRLVPPPGRQTARRIMSRLRDSWLGWLQGVAVDMVCSGILLYIGLTLVGLDFAIFFAVLTALFSVVPYFGAIASGIPPVLFAFTESPEKGLLVIAVYVAVQQIEGNVTIPLVMSRTVKLHPAVIAFGVIVVQQLFGYVGLIVAVPILSLIVVLVDELWVRPLELRAGVSELDRGDDDPDRDEDDDQDLHPDPEAGHAPIRSEPGAERSPRRARGRLPRA